MKILYDFFRKLILPFTEIERALPKSGIIIDLGCGEGLIAFNLSKNSKRQIIGIDANKKRLPKSLQKNLTFINEDITKLPPKKINGAVISDVLHHLSLLDQKKLLNNIYQNLKKNGVLVIKEIDTSEFIRSHLSRLWDFILYPQDKITFTSHKYLKDTLTIIGFKVEIARPCRYFPGSTTLYVCTKK